MRPAEPTVQVIVDPFGAVLSMDEQVWRPYSVVSLSLPITI